MSAMHRASKVRIRAVLAAAAMLLAATVSASAQTDFPNRPIKIVVPLPPGATADTLPRIIGEKLTAKWGQPVIIENRPGAAQNLGAEAVARAEPDGYTLLATPQGPLTVSASMFAKLNFDPAAFVPVTVMAQLPYVLVANPKVPFTTFPEMVAYAKANPGKLNYGSPGSGSSTHLSMEWLGTLAGIKLTHVPYKGAAPALTDLVAGHIEMMFDNLGNPLSTSATAGCARSRWRAKRASRSYPTLPRSQKHSPASSRPAGSPSSRRRRRRRRSRPSCRGQLQKSCACRTWWRSCSSFPRSPSPARRKRPPS
jgi:tripartite-type tricarboxylate transporter receptor subunit TctC